jgi:cobaltochelatase CobN
MLRNINRLLLRKNKKCLAIVILSLLFEVVSAHAASVAILEVDSNSYQVNLALQQLNVPKSIQTRFFTLADLRDNPEAKAYLEDCKVVYVNVMMAELATYMADEGLLAGRKVYALNQAGDPDKLKEQGFIYDAEVMAYYHNLTVANMVNMIRMGVHRHIEGSVTYEGLENLPEICLHHPDAPVNFETLHGYREW